MSHFFTHSTIAKAQTVNNDIAQVAGD